MRRIGLLAVVLVGGWSLACAGGGEGDAPEAGDGAGPDGDDGDGDVGEGEGEGDAGDGEGDGGEGEGDAGDGEDDAGDGEGDAGDGEDDAGEGEGDAGDGDGDEGDDGEGAAPRPAPKTLPEALDPVQTPPAQRQRALREEFQDRRDATDAIVRVLKTDPSNDVRATAADVLHARWKRGFDARDTEAAMIWCVSNAAPAVQVECLPALGERGTAAAGAPLNAATKSGRPEVKAAAESACEQWTKRFPKGVPGATGACKARK